MEVIDQGGSSLTDASKGAREMSGNVDEVKGRVKQAIGDLTDKQDLTISVVGVYSR
jgi:hypothetical protein